MVYLSKGMIYKNTSEWELHISRGKQKFCLTGIQAEVWNNGRFSFGHTKAADEEQALQELTEMGLAEYETAETSVDEYRVLTRCIFCVPEFLPHRFSLTRTERKLMRWIKKAGIHLSTAELIFLEENNVQPKFCMLYKINRQALTQRIYTANTITDTVLENQMEYAVCRDRVVGLLLNLLKKKYVVVV